MGRLIPAHFYENGMKSKQSICRYWMGEKRYKQSREFFKVKVHKREKKLPPNEASSQIKLILQDDHQLLDRSN